jgi:hypothetical protein
MAIYLWRRHRQKAYVNFDREMKYLYYAVVEFLIEFGAALLLFTMQYFERAG